MKNAIEVIFTISVTVIISLTITFAYINDIRQKNNINNSKQPNQNTTVSEIVYPELKWIDDGSYRKLMIKINDLWVPVETEYVDEKIYFPIEKPQDL